MRIAIVSAVCACATFCSIGCVVHEHREPRYVEREVVVEGPGVTVIEVEPPPPQRIYIYERGYPPGCYMYGGYVYYGQRRYERTVFVNRVVTVNVQRNVYVNVNENRRVGQQVERTHQVEFQRTGGRVSPAAHPVVRHPEHPVKPTPDQTKKPHPKDKQ
jgi:hypothetical protein